LTAAQRAGIAAELHGAPPIAIQLATVAGDDEAMAFAAELRETLDSCGWHAGPPVWFAAATPPAKARAIGLLIHSVEDAPPQVIQLQAALRSVGLDADAVVDNRIAPTTVTVFVGRTD
jgi:hypothetical protein